MVEVGEKCRSCKYWGFQTQSCDYCLITHHSRTIRDGKQIDAKYCDKFVEEKRTIIPNDWIKSEFQLRKARRLRRKKNG